LYPLGSPLPTTDPMDHVSLLTTLVYVMAWVFALGYLRFAYQSRPRGDGRGFATMRLLTVSIFVVILGVTVEISYGAARPTWTAY
jgi:hypothetical protein